MDIKVIYAGTVVGVFAHDSLFMPQLFERVANGQPERLLRQINQGLPVVLEDWDGQLIEFQKVRKWES